MVVAQVSNLKYADRIMVAGVTDKIWDMAKLKVCSGGLRL